MKLRIVTAGVLVAVAAGLSGAAGFGTRTDGGTHGAWATTAAGQTAGLYANEREGAVLAFHKDVKRPGPAAAFAIASTADGVVIQVVDAKGDVHQLPATALLKLKD